jgi:predicted Zn-dependent peptidase
LTQDSRREAVKLSVLPNGMRVVTETMPHLATAAIGVWSGAGSRHERPEEQGLAHLLEHMAFKGTTRRNALEIAEAIEAVGGDLNAETNTEYTAYFARLLGSDLPLAVDLLSDILTDPIFDADELKREKGVILQEIGAYEDTPDEVVFDMVMETAYAGGAIGRRILGTPKTVRAQNRETMRDFLNRNYCTPSMIVSAAGALDHDALVTEIGTKFDSFRREALSEPDAARYTGGEQRRVKKLEQAHVVLAFEGLSYRDPDHYVMHVLSHIIGGGMSSRLFQEIREKRGLCYEVYSFFSPFDDSGLFAVYGGTGETQLDDYMPLAIDTMRAAIEQPNDKEVARAKAQMKMSLLASLESPGRRAEQMARHMLVYGRVLPREEMVAAIDAITLDDVTRVGRHMLSTAPTLAGIGPIRKLESIERIAERLGSKTQTRSAA